MEAQYQKEVSESHKYQELLNKDRIEAQLIDLMDAVESGYIDALDAFATVHFISNVAAQVKKELQEHAVREGDLYAEKTFSKNGFQFTKMDGKATYSFKHIKEWVEAENKKKAIEQSAKTALKMAEKGQRLVSEDGEVIETAMVKYSAPTLSLKADHVE